MTTQLWSEAGMAGVIELVRRRTGLVFPPNRQGSAEAGIRRAMTRLGVTDPERYVCLLREGGAVLDDLVAEVTVGETYFFREPAQLSFIRNEVLPELVQAPGGERAIRVWSAGCASGEEPYSLAIILRELGLGERARILGTEISRPRLAAARHGRYRAWSLRGVPDEVVGKYFDRQGGGPHMVLDPVIRRSVEFRYLNLAEDQYPASSTGIWGMDLILCRNVLIYFDAETIKRVAQRLMASLSDRGWLFLGASDPMLAELIPCEVVTTGAGLAYRRREAGGGIRDSGFGKKGEAGSRVSGVRGREAGEVAGRRVETSTRAGLSSGPAPVTSPASATPPAPVTSPEIVAPPAIVAESVSGPVRPEGPAERVSAERAHVIRAYSERGFAHAAELARELLAQEPDDVVMWVLLVRSLANSGRLEEAGVACASALDRYRDSAELLYLHALLLAEAGRAAEAADAARRALYLDRRMVVAYLALGAALTRLGDPVRARRAFSNALDLLGEMQPGEVVPASDGESAFRLAQIARAQCSLLTEAGAIA
jgi:chemotaxis protein methyltransferase CheR